MSDLFEVFYKRRSIRKFTAEAVSREDLTTLPEIDPHYLDTEKEEDYKAWKKQKQDFVEPVFTQTGLTVMCLIKTDDEV